MKLTKSTSFPNWNDIQQTWFLVSGVLMVGIADEAPRSGLVSCVLLRGIFSTELKVVYVNNPSIAWPFRFQSKTILLQQHRISDCFQLLHHWCRSM
jgi:hypothetical protein